MAEALTPRQTEVFIAVLSLSSRKEAARELGISIHTVRGHLAHIRTRLDVDDCMQAAYVMGHEGSPSRHSLGHIVVYAAAHLLPTLMT